VEGLCGAGHAHRAQMLKIDEIGGLFAGGVARGLALGFALKRSVHGRRPGSRKTTVRLGNSKLSLLYTLLLLSMSINQKTSSIMQ